MLFTNIHRTVSYKSPPKIFHCQILNYGPFSNNEDRSALTFTVCQMCNLFIAYTGNRTDLPIDNNYLILHLATELQHFTSTRSAFATVLYRTDCGASCFGLWTVGGGGYSSKWSAVYYYCLLPLV